MSLARVVRVVTGILLLVPRSTAYLLMAQATVEGEGRISRGKLLQQGLGLASLASAGPCLAMPTESDRVRGYLRECLRDWSGLADGEIELKQISGGITNTIYKAFNSVTHQAVLVRIYGQDTDLLLDRQREIRVFQELARKNVGPSLLGQFRGGRIEELLDARASTVPELLQTKPFDVPAAIAVETARLHHQDVLSAGRPSLPVMWPTIDEWLATAKRLDKKGKYPLDEVTARVAWLRTRLPEGGRQLPAADESSEAKAMRYTDEVVFAHNDLLSGNILVGPKEGPLSTLRLIDFEYSAYNPRGYDLANHLCETAGFEGNYERDFPTSSQVIHFLKCYAEAERPEMCESLKASGRGSNGERTFYDQFAKEVGKYTLASHLTWELWAYIQAETSKIDFDFADYGKIRHNGFAFHRWGN
ncbi:unnamed protein product [Chrysoparadoxa australica]